MHGRLATLAGLAAGVASSQALSAPAGWLAAVPGLIAIALAARRVRSSGASAVLSFTVAPAVLAFVLGLGLGGERLAAIDAGAMTRPAGRELVVRGPVTGSPWRQGEQVRVPISTPLGRVVVTTTDDRLSRDPPIGRMLRVEGILRPVSAEDAFLGERLRRLGISHELHASGVRQLRARRGGLLGALDSVRGNAEAALAAGLDARQASLARGFVLGADERLDPGVEEDFRRTGLAHLVAVSGQNVMLLATLAGVALGLLGLGLRARLLVTIALIALYVPVTGAAASIQRAAVMGSAGILMTVLGRPSDRAFTLVCALAATLLVNPRFTGDPGWQLSFAAVAGIGLWAARLRALLVGRWPLTRLPPRAAGPVAEAAALTVAATIATAPLIAFTFERLSLVTLLANLLVAPAVAPTMWLGMIASALGQLAGSSLVANAIGLISIPLGLLIDYIAVIAEQLGGLDWAEAEVRPPSPAALIVLYCCLLSGVGSLLAIAERRRGLVLAPSRGRRVLALVSVTALGALLVLPSPDGVENAPPAPGQRVLRVVVLDVGQGDAILLIPPGGPPILVDAGPGDADVGATLEHLGVTRLGALLLTHDHADHTGGAGEVLDRLDVDLFARPAPIPELDRHARSRGVRVVTLGAGSGLRVGRISLDVLWPTAEGLRAGAEDPNASSLVLLAEGFGRRVLLTGDAEQELTHLHIPPIDLLKVAHHGSADAGLADLLRSARPALAAISAGENNPYGHPSPLTTAALVRSGVCVLRTDQDGTTTVDLGLRGVRAWGERAGSLGDRPGCEPSLPASAKGSRSRP